MEHSLGDEKFMEIFVREHEDMGPTVKPKHRGEIILKWIKKCTCLVTVRTKFNTKLESIRVGESYRHELTVTVSLTLQAFFTK
jgi:hypothetical protein